MAAMNGKGEATVQVLLARAQVHATLALVAQVHATLVLGAAALGLDDSDNWPVTS
jgi:hypothetical protein